MLAYSYLRFSTPDQIKGDSLRRQLEKSEKYAEEHGLTLDKTTRMQDLGISAFDKSNVVKGELGVFLRAVEQKRIPVGSYLLVESLDRLSRANVMDALQPFINLLNAGIIIVTLGDNQKYSRESITDNWAQLIISIAVMSRAHEESATKSMRIKASWVKKKQQMKDGVVLTSRVPYWMETTDKEIRLIPERAEVVRRIFQLSKDGVGTPTITKILNSDTPAWSKSGVWYQAYIVKLLQSTATYGAIQLNDQVIEDYYPAVITKDEWSYISALKSGRRLTVNPGRNKSTTLSNLFSGITYCGYCNAKMTFQQYRNGSALQCYGARSGATKCKCINWDYKEIEYFVLSRIVQLDLNTLFGALNSDKASELEQSLITISAKIDANKQKVENLYIAIEEKPLKGLTQRVEILEAEIDTDEEKKKKILQELSTEKVASSSVKERRASLQKLWKMQIKCEDELALRTIRETLHAQIKSIIERIDLYPTGPSLNRAEKEMRFMNVLLRSGSIVHIANS